MIEESGTHYKKITNSIKRKFFKKNMRYEYLIDIIEYLEPKSIIEIGVAEGKNAEEMLRKTGNGTKYTGYDVFDFTDKIFHNLVGNGKMVLSEEEIFSKLSTLSADVTLHKGMTQDTLWPKGDKADLVWLDGDHRIEAIRKDFEAVKKSRVIVLDDYYIEDNQQWSIDKYGCNELVKSLQDVIITPATRKLESIRLAVWSNDKKILDDLREIIKPEH
jgi:hypothetical protein